MTGLLAVRDRWNDLPRAARVALGIGLPTVVYLLLYKVVPFTDGYIAENAPHEPIIVGMIYGTVNALLAIGLILVYRTNRFINFSYAAMGSLFGFLGITLHIEYDWPYFVVLPIAVVCGIALGAGIEVAVIRRFRDSSRLVATVASIGLAQAIGGIEVFVLAKLGKPLFQSGFTVPISFSLDLGNKTLIGDEVLIVLVVPFIIAGLAWFLLRTDAGVAVRAAAENADRALLLGIPIRRLATIVWAIAGGLATLTFMLKAPFAGAAPSAGQGITVLLPALAAAVVARLESLPIAFAAGVGLGIMESLVRWNSTGDVTLDKVVFLVVILVALLAQRGKLSRAMLGDGGGGFSSVVKPTPMVLRRLPEVRYAKYGLLALVLALALWVPSLWNTSTQFSAVLAVATCMTGVSLVVLTGWGGHISLGQFAFVGVGAVVCGNLVAEERVDLFLALLAAGAAGGLCALIVGLPALRIKGLFLAVTTLSFAVALNTWFLNPTERAWAIPTGVRAPLLWERFDLESNYALYVFSLAFLGLSILAALGIRGARSGRVVIATRDNERAADAAAVPTTNAKLSAFLLSGVIAGVAGGLYMMALTEVGVNEFEPGLSLDVFTTSVIGGLGSITGAVSGVVLFKLLAQWQALDELRNFVTGVGLLIVLYALPGGLGQLLFGLRDRYLRWVANRRGILVPSLVADKREDEEGEQHAADEVDLLSGALSGEPATTDADDDRDLVGARS